jgi:hypothetical protein
MLRCHFVLKRLYRGGVPVGLEMFTRGLMIFMTFKPRHNNHYDIMDFEL